MYRYPNYPQCHGKPVCRYRFVAILLWNQRSTSSIKCVLTAPWNELTIADPYRRIVYRYNTHIVTETYLDVRERFH